MRCQPHVQVSTKAAQHGGQRPANKPADPPATRPEPPLNHSPCTQRSGQAATACLACLACLAPPASCAPHAQPGLSRGRCQATNGSCPSSAPGRLPARVAGGQQMIAPLSGQQELAMHGCASGGKRRAPPATCCAGRAALEQATQSVAGKALGATHQLGGSSGSGGSSSGSSTAARATTQQLLFAKTGWSTCHARLAGLPIKRQHPPAAGRT